MAKKRRKQPKREETPKQSQQRLENEDSDEEPECTICSHPGNLITPCNCADAKYYHYNCVSRWIMRTNDKPCEVCRERYTDYRIKRQTNATFMAFLWHNLILTIMFVLNIICLVISGSAYFMAEGSMLSSFGIGFIPFIVWALVLSIAVDTRYQNWFRDRQLIYFYEFNGEDVEPGKVLVFNLGASIAHHSQQIIRNQMNIDQNEAQVQQWQAQLAQAAAQAAKAAELQEVNPIHELDGPEHDD